MGASIEVGRHTERMLLLYTTLFMVHGCSSVLEGATGGVGGRSSMPFARTLLPESAYPRMPPLAT